MHHKKFRLEQRRVYFFTQRVAKYQSSRISDRKTNDGKGYWKKGKCEEFERGIKNNLVYCLKGGNEKSKGQKTDWIMHEYVLRPADAKVKVNTTTVLCRIHHKKQKQKQEETDICNVTAQKSDSFTKYGRGRDESREKLTMIESSQEYQQKNITAPANEEIVCIDLCSDDDESSQGYDQLKNSILENNGRGGDKLMMIESSQEYQQKNIAALANEEIVCINMCSDDDNESCQSYDQLKNSIPENDERSRDGSGENLMMIESNQEYQQKNIAAPANEGIVCINMCSDDDDESSPDYDQLKNSIPANDGRGRDGSGEVDDD